MAFDSARGVTVEFGGSAEYETVVNRETWEWDGTAWTLRATTGPSARKYAAMAYDRARGVSVLFGGWASRPNDSETWEWDGIRWTQQSVTGPSGRQFHAMTYDSVRGVVVLFGGQQILPSGQSVELNDTWEWDGARWTQRAVAGPSARSRHVMAFDSSRGVSVLCGGFAGSGGSRALQETWEWDGAAWVSRTTGDLPILSPEAMAFDSIRGVSVVYGRTAAGRSTAEWNGLTWSLRSTTPAPSTSEPQMNYDSVRGVCVLFGGRAESVTNETWEWNGSIWAMRMGSPGRREASSMVFNANDGVSVLCGGSTPAGAQPFTWIWSGGAWSSQAASSACSRAQHAMAHDIARGVTVVFGGEDAGSATGALLRDTWERGDAGWVRRVVVGASPSARRMHSMVYDSARGVTVLFGGSGASGTLGDTWEWNGAAWTLRSAAGPSARNAHAMAYDNRRRVVVLFGGEQTLSNGVHSQLNDTWEWDGVRWTQRAVMGPSARSRHAMAYDAALGVTVLTGGSRNGLPSDETWIWNGSLWSQVSATGPTGRYSHAMAFDPVRGQTVLFGGQDRIGPDGETWGLTLSCSSPRVMVAPQPAAICQAGSAAVSVGVAGTGPMEYQWQLEVEAGRWVTLGADPVLLPGGGFAFAAPANDTSTRIGVRGRLGSLRVRCVIGNSCGEATSDAAVLSVCPADFNCDGRLDPDDLSDFITCYFGDAAPGGSCPLADFDGSGTVDADDLSEFVTAYFGGC